MIVVSNDFKTAMKQPVKEIQAFLEADGIVIRDDDDLISFKISCDGGLCKSVMRKLEAKYLREHNLVGKWVTAGFGVKLASGAYEYLNYGSFLVSEQTTTKDTGVTDVVAYDRMINAMSPYEVLNIEYPVSLYDYTAKLCEACGTELGSALFGYNLWDVSKQKVPNNITYDNVTGVYTASDNDTRSPLAYKMQQCVDTTYINNTNVLKEISGVGVYMFTATRAENATHIRLANNGVAREFSVYYPIPASIAVGDTFTVALEIIDASVGASAFKNVMLYKGDSPLAYLPYNTMNGWQIERELWGNIDGITYRDIFVQIAQATGSTCIVSNDDKVYFKPLTETGEKLTYDNMMKLKLEPVYGEINSVVLSRQPQEDNVYLRDEGSVLANGLTEFRIDNNEIVDKDREAAASPIFGALCGISYYPFETTTEGLGWYEVGDCFTIINDTGDAFHTALFNVSVLIDGSVKETLKTAAEPKAQTQYEYAKSIAKRLKTAEIVVNKQDQYIQSLVKDMYDEGGVVNEKYTQIYQDVKEIVASAQNSGGNNLLKNSVMFAYDGDTPTNWETDGTGTLTVKSDTESLSNGGQSGRSFTLDEMTVRQTVSVKVSTESEPTQYTFSTKIKKNAVGTCYVRVYNDSGEEYNITLASGENAFYAEREIVGMQPKANYYVVEFYGSAGSGATFTDNMFAVGEYKSQWTQANGEVMNTQVNISVDGVRVNRADPETGETINGEYTVMSPYEFAGYNENKPVFSLNKDVTTLNKLKAEDEIKMPPIKVVPITEGELLGWAFVPAT